MKKHILLLSLLSLWSLVSFMSLAHAQSGTVSVRYRSADTIYLDAGTAAGIDVGDRLEVLRGGRVIAEIEVISRPSARPRRRS